MNGEVSVDNYPANEPRFSRAVAIELTNINLEFLDRCEKENLIETQAPNDRDPAYSLQDIRRMALIYRLHEILGVHVADLEIVLHLRQQVLDLLQQVEDLERLWIEREEQLVGELTTLRMQFADEGDWKD